MEEKYSILHEEREEKKKKLTPRLCSIGEYSVRTEKKNTSAQKHIYHRHNFATGGNISSSGKQPSGPVPFVSAPVADPLNQAWRNKAGGTWSGEGSNVCNRGGSKRSPTAALFPGLLSSMALAEAGWCGGARKDKIDLFCLWGEQLHTFTAILSVNSGLRKNQFSLAKP